MSKTSSNRVKLPTLASIDGWGLNISSRRHALKSIKEDMTARRGFVLWCLNLDYLVKLRGDRRFREIYKSASYVMADGAPVAVLARWQTPTLERSPGPDLMVPLCQQAARNGVPIYMFGTRQDVLEKGAKKLRELAPGLDIRGIEAPPYGYDPESAQADADADRMAASGAKIVLLGLGAPKQELFAARAIERHPDLGFLCIGAALDFLVGEQQRAPSYLRNHGFEWLYRLAANPRRLGMRYLRSALVLGDIVVVDRLRRWIWPTASGSNG